MTRITDDFMRNFEQSAVMPTDDKDKVAESAKAQGKGGLGATSSVTVDATSQPTSGSSSIPIALVPPPTMNPNEIMTQVQSLQSKMSTNQMSSSSHQLSTDHLKMNKAIKDYNDRIKKEHEQQHKAHSKGLIGKIVDGIEDAVEVTAGVALCLVPGAQIAGAALLATAAINITDQVVTGAFGNKPLLTGKDAEIFNYCAMGATIMVGVATMGAGLAASGAAVAADAAEDSADAIEMTEMATQATEDTTTTTSTAVKAGTTAQKVEDVEDTVEVAEDVGDSSGDEDVEESGDESGDEDMEDSRDDEVSQRERTSSMRRMEESFEKGFEEDVVDDTGDTGDGSGDGDDDGSTRVPRRDAALTGAQHGAGGPLGIEDLLPTPDFAAQRRVLLGSSGTSGAGQTQDAALTTDGQQSQGSDLTMKIDPNTADSNAAVVAMMAAGLAMIQAQQTSAKAEDTERKSDLHSYEDKMDSAVQDLRTAASDTWKAALTEGITGIAGAAFSMAGAGLGAFGQNLGLSQNMTSFLGGAGENPGMVGLSGSIIGMSGKLGGASFTQDATNKEADQKTAEKFAGVFQSATQNAAQYRDTFFQTQTSVIQALQQIVQGEGAAEQSAASGRA